MGHIQHPTDICYPYAIPSGIYNKTNHKTYLEFHSGHPFSKPTLIKSRVSEVDFKKCGKQEKSLSEQ
jgi:hypothetical protein